MRSRAAAVSRLPVDAKRQPGFFLHGRGFPAWVPQGWLCRLPRGLEPVSAARTGFLCGFFHPVGIAEGADATLQVAGSRQGWIRRVPRQGIPAAD